MITIFPSIWSTMSFANQPKLCSKSTPINGGGIALDPFSDPLISRNSHKQTMVENLHYRTLSICKTKVVANQALVKIHGSETHVLDLHGEQETITGHTLERNHRTHKFLTRSIFNRKDISNCHFLSLFLFNHSTYSIGIVKKKNEKKLFLT